METSIPFCGFYGSWWSQEIDSCEEMEVEHLAEESGVPADRIANIMWCYTNYLGVHEGLAKAYVDHFNTWLNENLDLDVKLTFTILVSPREYNFTTDRIFVEISRSDFAKIYRKVGKAAVRAKAEEMFKSRSGFISHYPWRLDEWGPVREWDYNQAGAVMEAAVAPFEDWEMDVFNAASDTSEFWKAFESGVDWPALKAALAEVKVDLAEAV